MSWQNNLPTRAVQLSPRGCGVAKTVYYWTPKRDGQFANVVIGSKALTRIS